jgi:hypothetical protein
MDKTPEIFNSRVELATRASLILTSLEGRVIDVDTLATLDYALIYSREFGGPENLHPLVPNHVSELAQRRELLPSALLFYIGKGIISKVYREDGQYYSANNNTINYVGGLKSEYYQKIWSRLSWMTDNYQEISMATLRTIYNRAY